MGEKWEAGIRMSAFLFRSIFIKIAIGNDGVYKIKTFQETGITDLLKRNIR